jgi:putative transposase
MPYELQKHRRRSIRLKGYDYTLPGAYFVTICTQNHVMLFEPPQVQAMLQKRWDELPIKFPNVKVDTFGIMPNHIHGIVFLIEKSSVGVDPCVDLGQTHRSAPTISLAKVVQWFKTMTTNDYIRGVKQFGWIHFSGRVWQRNYYEHIIRNESDLHFTRTYIANNPNNWPGDQMNPNSTLDRSDHILPI